MTEQGGWGDMKYKYICEGCGQEVPPEEYESQSDVFCTVCEGIVEEIKEEDVASYYARRRAGEGRADSLELEDRVHDTETGSLTEGGKMKIVAIVLNCIIYSCLLSALVYYGLFLSFPWVLLLWPFLWFGGVFLCNLIALIKSMMINFALCLNFLMLLFCSYAFYSLYLSPNPNFWGTLFASSFLLGTSLCSVIALLKLKREKAALQ